MKTIKKIVTGLLVVVILIAGTGTVKAGGAGSDIAAVCMDEKSDLTYFIDLRFRADASYPNKKVKIDLILNDHVTFNTNMLEFWVQREQGGSYEWLPQDEAAAIEYRLTENHVYAIVPAELLTNEVIVVRVFATSTEIENLTLGTYNITLGDDFKQWADNTLSASGVCPKDEGVSTNPPGVEEKPTEGEDGNEGPGNPGGEKPTEPEVPEEKPVEKPDEESPNTGDPMAPYLWSTLMLVGATTLVGVSKTNKRRK